MHFAARAGNEELCRILTGTIGINIDATDSVEVVKLVFFKFLISKVIFMKGRICVWRCRFRNDSDFLIFNH